MDPPAAEQTVSARLHTKDKAYKVAPPLITSSFSTRPRDGITSSAVLLLPLKTRLRRETLTALIGKQAGSVLSAIDARKARHLSHTHKL